MRGDDDWFIYLLGKDIGNKKSLLTLLDIIKKIFPVKAIYINKEYSTSKYKNLNDEILKHYDTYIHPPMDAFVVLRGKNYEVGTIRPLCIRIANENKIIISVEGDYRFSSIIPYFSDYYNKNPRIINTTDKIDRGYINAIKKYYNVFFLDCTKQFGLKLIKFENTHDFYPVEGNTCVLFNKDLLDKIDFEDISELNSEIDGYCNFDPHTNTFCYMDINRNLIRRFNYDGFEHKLSLEKQYLFNKTLSLERKSFIKKKKQDNKIRNLFIKFFKKSK